MVDAQKVGSANDEETGSAKKQGEVQIRDTFRTSSNNEGSLTFSKVVIGRRDWSTMEGAGMNLIIDCLKYLLSGQKRNTFQDQHARDQSQYNRMRKEKILSLSQVKQFRGLVLELIATSRPSQQIGQLFQLHGGRMVIGRSLNCEVWIDSQMVSRQHAAITVHQGQCQLIDLKSASGTYVNSAPITGPVELNDGDVIRISCVLMRFHASYVPKNPL